MKQYFTSSLLVIFLFLGMNTIHAQIEISQKSADKQKQEKKEKMKKKPRDTTFTSNTEFFLSANWSSSSRLLRENEGLYGNALGDREDESSLGIWSYGIGFRSQVTNHFMWEGGISFLRNGESYLFEAADSTFSYETKYGYISMPIKAYYTIGDDIKFIAGGGLIPQMFFQYSQQQEWVTSTNTPGSELIERKNGYSTVVLSVVFSAGIQANMGNDWNIFVLPEYRHQLTNSFVATDSYEHFNRSLGVSFGFSRAI